MHVTFKGFAETERNLKRVHERIKRGAMREALAKASRPIIKRARELAPKESGALRKALGRITKTIKGEVRVRIGIRRGKSVDYQGEKRNPSRYAHLVELGSSKNRAHPFMRPALEEKKEEAIQIYKETLGPAIEKAAARVAKSEARRNKR